MFKSDDTMLMIASSTQNSPFPSVSKLNDPGPEVNIRGRALKSSNFDLTMFKKKFKDHNFHQIETSSDGKILLPREYIVNWLALKFNTSLCDVYLFYTGHGHENGDWPVETVESPQGDRLSLKEMSQIWRDNRRSEKSHLYIFMDSCYSGSWCIEVGRLNQELKKQGQPDLNISVFAACGFNKACTSMRDGGGLFASCILQSQQLNEQDIKLLYKIQTPLFNNNMRQAAPLQPEHIRLLQQSITNAARITTEPDRMLRRQDNQSEEQKRRREMQQQEKKQKEQRERQQRERKQKEQEEIKKMFMKKAKVDSWTQLSTKKQLDLWKCGVTKLPDQIGNLTKLARLELNSNNLSEVPNTIGNLSNLQVLDLGKNQLRSVPGSMERLVELKRRMEKISVKQCNPLHASIHAYVDLAVHEMLLCYFKLFLCCGVAHFPIHCLSTYTFKITS